jgi:hypothetical protein
MKFNIGEQKKQMDTKAPIQPNKSIMETILYFYYLNEIYIYIFV